MPLPPIFYNPDPLREIGDAGWYYRDECGEAHGPYDSREQAEDMLREYWRLYL